LHGGAKEAPAVGAIPQWAVRTKPDP